MSIELKTMAKKDRRWSKESGFGVFFSQLQASEHENLVQHPSNNISILEVKCVELCFHCPLPPKFKGWFIIRNQKWAEIDKVIS